MKVAQCFEDDHNYLFTGRGPSKLILINLKRTWLKRGLVKLFVFGDRMY